MRVLRPRSLALVVALAAAVAGWSGRAAAQQARIGYIDSARIFAEYKDAQEAQQRFDRLVQGWRDEATEKEREVQALRKEVQDQGPILSAAKRQEKEEQLQRKISDYERFVQEVWGPGGRASVENENATKVIVEQIRSAVEKVASGKGLNLVLDSAGGFIIYIDKAMDLTADVLAELRERSGRP